jgi:hypothetical protein
VYFSCLFDTTEERNMQKDAEKEAQPEEPSEIPIAVPAICVAEYGLAAIDVKVLMEERLPKGLTVKSSINDSNRDLRKYKTLLLLPIQ